MNAKSIAFAVVSLFCLVDAWLMIQPVPTAFQQIDGPVEHAESVRKRAGMHQAYVTELHFSMAGHPEKFVVGTSMLTTGDSAAWAMMRPGATAKVLYLGSYPGRPTVWGLTIGNTVALEPAHKTLVDRMIGYLLLMGAFLSGMVALFPKARQSEGL